MVDEVFLKEIKDCDKRLTALEMTKEVHEAEISSLRASRHEYGNWLNRHNLEISELNLQRTQISSTINVLSVKIDKLETDINSIQISMIQQMALLKSDLRQTMWIVSLLVGILVFFGRGIAAKFGF
jgi:chromosome segregation ATPase